LFFPPSFFPKRHPELVSEYILPSIEGLVIYILKQVQDDGGLKDDGVLEIMAL
jgi:hypothetical protein